MDRVTLILEELRQVSRVGRRLAWVYAVNSELAHGLDRTRESRVRSRRGGRSMNRGLIGTIIGVLVIIILVIVILQLT